jgi:hypothetical protein
MKSIVAPILSLLVGAAVLAYNPPSDTTGPLTVQMQPPAVGAYGAGGYADLVRAGAPFVVPVSLQNAGDRNITGTLRMTVIDGWKVAPAGGQPFQIGPHGRLRREFTLSFPPATYNAHYPIHVYAEFEWGGQKLIAHPVMMVQPRIPDLPRPKLPVEWRPVPVPKGGTLGLWRMPVRRETVEVANTGVETGAAGREVFDAASVILYGAMTWNGGAREGIGMTLGQRPPSRREVVEAAAVEFPLALPAVTPLRLEFEMAGTCSFEVKAAPLAGGVWTTLFQRRSPGGSNSAPISVDLARYAGSSIRLRLEARDGTSEAQWAEPTIVAGDPPKISAFPPVSRDSRLLGTADGCEVRLWPGSRGLLDAPVGFQCGGRRLFFRGLRVRVTGDALEEWRASSELLNTREEPASGRVRVRHRFHNWAGAFDLMTELWVEREALRARVWLENTPVPQPWFQVYLEGVSAGAWSETVARVYGGPGNVIEKPRAFRLGFDGHNLSTSFVGFDFANGTSLVQNSDTIPDRLEVDPERRIYSLVTPHSQTLEFFPARNVFAAVKRIREQDTRRPSKGVAKLAGRFTFDLWNGRYADGARNLERAAEYGVKDALMVWHSWQRWGYDYRLPDIYPPNPQFGTVDEFRELAAACKRNGTLFAPHDNYIDFYPDSEGFTYDSIVFRQNGTPYRAWFNYGREAQSYRARPDRLLPYVKRNVGLIKDGFAPSAYFIDVWSSMAPYDYWTEDGKFVDRRETQRVWGGVFAWIRDYLGDDAPQISEAGHDKLIGWLDGADAQQLRIDPEGRNFTWKIQCADSERIPWVDVAWHDKFILHGAGYEGRYQGGLDQREHGAYSDDYITTEVLSGRPAMTPQAFSRDVVRVYWLLNEAMKALALDRIDTVEFVGNDIHRQHVKWERGGEVWVNRGVEAWTVEGHTLPRYGFYLRAGETEAAIELRGGERWEWSRSGQQRYEGGRLTMASGKVMQLPAK